MQAYAEATNTINECEKENSSVEVSFGVVCCYGARRKSKRRVIVRGRNKERISTRKQAGGGGFKGSEREREAGAGSWPESERVWRWTSESARVRKRGRNERVRNGGRIKKREKSCAKVADSPGSRLYEPA